MCAVVKLTGPNNGLGRPKGALNHATRELKEFWHLFFTSEDYREKAKFRIKNGDAPQLETYLLSMVYGKPRETVDLHIGVGEDLSGLSVDELHERAQTLVDRLKDADAMAKAIPAEFVVEPAADANQQQETQRQERLSVDHANTPAQTQAESPEA